MEETVVEPEKVMAVWMYFVLVPILIGIATAVVCLLVLFVTWFRDALPRQGLGGLLRRGITHVTEFFEDVSDFVGDKVGDPIKYIWVGKPISYPHEKSPRSIPIDRSVKVPPADYCMPPLPEVVWDHGLGTPLKELWQVEAEEKDKELAELRQYKAEQEKLDETTDRHLKSIDPTKGPWITYGMTQEVYFQRMEDGRQAALVRTKDQILNRISAYGGNDPAVVGQLHPVSYWVQHQMDHTHSDVGETFIRDAILLAIEEGELLVGPDKNLRLPDIPTGTPVK